jgi:hypothetical protein
MIINKSEKAHLPACEYEQRPKRRPNPREIAMINYLTFIAVAAIGLTVASAPALAKSRGVQLGHEARAQAIESLTEGVSLDRAQALRSTR